MVCRRTWFKTSLSWVLWRPKREIASLRNRIGIVLDDSLRDVYLSEFWGRIGFNSGCVPRTMPNCLHVIPVPYTKELTGQVFGPSNRNIGTMHRWRGFQRNIKTEH